MAIIGKTDEFEHKYKEKLSLFNLIQTLIDVKFIEVKLDPGEFMSVAPCHHRQV